jgi:maltooligosyltrehalose trehalohydrolase
LTPAAFICFLQNHDQIGNRAFGERIDALADPQLVGAAHACLLLSPHAPMFFMGEEFAASTPFLYFCDFHGDLGRAVSEGRRAEFGRFASFSEASVRERIPDPNDAQTFASSKLRWDERESGPHRDRLELIRELLALRKHHLVPRLVGQMRGGTYRNDRGLLSVEWTLGDGSPWHMLANFGAEPASGRTVPQGDAVYRNRVEVRADGTLELAPGAVLVVKGDRAGK